MAFLCLSVFSADSRGTGVFATLALRGRAAPSRLGPSILLLQARVTNRRSKREHEARGENWTDRIDETRLVDDTLFESPK